MFKEVPYPKTAHTKMILIGGVPDRAWAKRDGKDFTTVVASHFKEEYHVAILSTSKEAPDIEEVISLTGIQSPTHLHIPGIIYLVGTKPFVNNN